MVETASHWDKIYATADPTKVGWFEPAPCDLDLVLRHSTSSAAVVDVGGGNGPLAAALVAEHYEDLSVVDISAEAIDHGRARVGAAAADIDWLVGDVTTLDTGRRWDLWHDRAVFHFLCDSDDRRAYVATLDRHLSPDGRAIVVTFSPDGPETCAGLPVHRYDAETLAAEFAPTFQVLDARPVGPCAEAGDQRPLRRRRPRPFGRLPGRGHLGPANPHASKESSALPAPPSGSRARASSDMPSP